MKCLYASKGIQRATYYARYSTASHELIIQNNLF